MNAAVVEMAHRIERGELEPRIENYAELAQLAGLRVADRRARCARPLRQS